MNLIQQLQTTPKWKEFEEWYNTYYLTNKHVPSLSTLEQVPYDMYKGVFEKFISENNTDITVDGYLGNETYGIGSSFTDWKWFENFEQLLIWYFNN